MKTTRRVAPVESSEEIKTRWTNGIRELVEKKEEKVCEVKEEKNGGNLLERMQLIFKLIFIIYHFFNFIEC